MLKEEDDLPENDLKSLLYEEKDETEGVTTTNKDPWVRHGELKPMYLTSILLAHLDELPRCGI
jgi:hypothetical protein